MDTFWGLTSAAWTAVGAIAGCASLVTAVIIAIIVQRGGRRADAAARRITQSIEELVRRSRRDDLLQQLRIERDPTQLALLVDEARAISAERSAERLGLEKAYFTNPSAPLLTSPYQIAGGLGEAARTTIISAVVDALPERYKKHSSPPASLAGDLAQLTRLAADADAPTYRIAEFLLERSDAGWNVHDDVIRTILHPEAGYACQPNLDTAGDYLHGLRQRGRSSATLVNAVAGVSLAICDFYRRGSFGVPPTNTYTAYIMLMQRNLVGIGKVQDTNEMSIAIDYAIAVMVDALGLVSGRDAHLNMRALQALNPLLASFPADRFASSGPVADHLSKGVRRLLATNASEYDRARLHEQASRLVPSFSP